MPIQMIGYHVEDASTGLRALGDDREIRRANGAGQEYLYQGVVDPTEILVSIEWDVADRARLYACSDDLRDLLRRSGSTGPHRVWVLADDGTTVLPHG